jgi:hypothetical protein
LQFDPKSKTLVVLDGDLALDAEEIRFVRSVGGFRCELLRPGQRAQASLPHGTERCCGVLPQETNS